MWLLIFVVPLALAVVIGSMLAGGIFTIVFLPLGLLIVGLTILFTIWGRSQRRPAVPSDRTTTSVEPGTGHSNLSARPNTPDDLVNSRRQAQ
jgi:hypothetical protein